MTNTAIILTIAAAAITIINCATMFYNYRQHKATMEWHEAIANRRKLKDYQKRRMCNRFCKYRESAKTQEDLDWQCEQCPLNDL